MKTRETAKKKNYIKDIGDKMISKLYIYITGFPEGYEDKYVEEEISAKYRESPSHTHQL